MVELFAIVILRLPGAFMITVFLSGESKATCLR